MGRTRKDKTEQINTHTHNEDFNGRNEHSDRPN